MAKSNNPKGRDKIPIYWETIDDLLMIHCTGEEVAALLDISYDTIERRCKAEKKMSFADYSKQKRFAGKPSLRRAQWIAATEDKNPTMLIWLGKLWIEMDHAISEFSGARFPGELPGPFHSVAR